MNKPKAPVPHRGSGPALCRALAACAAGLAIIGVAQPAQAHPEPHAVAAHYAADHMGSGLQATTSVHASAATTPPGTPGVDVSGWDGTVDWSSAALNGAAFAYVKATEGIGYVSDTFEQQYNGAAGEGLLHGAYHFALPDRSDGTTQADYFVDHGGRWSNDGMTLPGVLDIEYNPYGATCYGLSQSAMVTWISQFRTEYQARTGRYPVIYAGLSWWTECTGNYAGFAALDPLWIAHYATTVGTLLSGWTTYTIWQYAGSGAMPGDQNVFAGNLADLKAFAAGQTLPAPKGWPTVQQGQSGQQVTTVQYLLNAHGASLSVDGQFGPATASAVQTFQTAHGLPADGIVAATTWQALVVTLQQGSSGPAVQAAQGELAAHGASLTLDGQFGPATASAVQAVQTAHGLSADGVIAASTWQVLTS